MIEEAAQPRAFSWLAGRAGRREYWANVAILLAVSLALPGPPLIRLVMTALLFVAQVRRVHDFGRTGGWAAAATMAPAAGLALWPVVTEETLFYIGLGIELAMIVAIGATPGSAAENRFGPPPPFTLRRLLTGR